MNEAEAPSDRGRLIVSCVRPSDVTWALAHYAGCKRGFCTTASATTDQAEPATDASDQSDGS